MVLANRDLMVYNEGEFTERHVYDRSFRRASTTFTYMDDTTRGQPGENIASDTAVNHTEKLVYRTSHLTSALFAVDETGAVDVFSKMLKFVNSKGVPVGDGRY